MRFLKKNNILNKWGGRVWTMLTFLSIGLVCCLQNAQAQKLKDDEIEEIQNIIELLAEDNETIANNDTYFELLSDLYDNKIDLNKASADKLAVLGNAGLLTERQINSLIQYREEVGKIINKYELQAIPKWDLNTIRKVLPFVKIKGDIGDFNVPLGKLLFGGKHELFIRYGKVLEEQRGYIPRLNAEGEEETPYLGSQHKLYLRYRHKYGQKISYGLTAEKDAGEEFFKGSQSQGFDYYSAHLFVKDVGPFKSVAIGDYHLRLGQGLTAWTDVGVGKSPYIEGIKRQGAVINPYTSVNEYRFFRGLAATAELSKKIDLTGFVSYKNVDNLIERDTLEEIGLIVVSTTVATESGNIIEDGLHRTQAEIDKKHANTQINAGGDLTYRGKKLVAGISSIYTQFENGVNLDVFGTDPYNLFRFKGEQHLNISAHYRYLVGNINFFGETALSNDMNGQIGWATLNGALLSLHPTVDASILFRHFEPEFQSLFGDPFMESSTPNNETGIFTGLQIKPSKVWTIQAYSDLYKHPWLRFRIDGPSWGHEKLIQVTYKPSRSLVIYGRFDTKTEGRNLTSDAEDALDANADYVYAHKRTRYRLDLRYKLNKAVTLKSRVQLSSFEDGVLDKQRGYMVYQELSYQPLSSPVSFNTRYAFFDIESWDARIYAYEKDVLYFFSIPPFNNRGRRFYFNLRYNLSKNITLWGRYARTTYDNLDEVGNGNEASLGNTRTDVKAQVRIRF